MYYGYRTHVEADAEVYRLFFKAPDFDPDVEDFDLPFWANWCMNPKCLDFILNFQFHFYDMPISERFEIAIRMHSSAVPPTCSDFVRLIGLSRTDHRLATLRTSNGETVLHYVARRLGFVVSRKDTRPLDEALQDWVSFGESILRMGADLCSLSTGTFLNDDWEMTPLMKFLDITFGWEPSGPLEAKVQHIRTWAGMIQQAGIDLCHYGVSETRVWRMLKSLQRPSQEALLDRMIMVEQILYGPTPVDWSLMVCFPFTTRVYELHPMPGAFNEDGEQPRKVIWKPTEAEEDEGPWDVVHSKATCSSRADLRDLAILSEAPFSQLLDATQDDHGVIMRLHYQISHAKRCSRDSRRRSHSQPPLLRRREAAYYAQLRSSTHSWLPPLHLCPFDSQWKVGCDPGSFQKHHLWGHGIYTVFNVRSCAKGVFEACASLQESQRWHDNSFLGLIRDCQHRSVDTGEPQSIRHAGTDTCPQGCSKIDLSQLNVPESLKSYHPQRWYEDDS